MFTEPPSRVASKMLVPFIADSPLAANRRKLREHRARLRAQGMRPIQIWVPDVHAPEFAAEARRQSLLANR